MQPFTIQRINSHPRVALNVKDHLFNARIFCCGARSRVDYLVDNSSLNENVNYDDEWI